MEISLELTDIVILMTALASGSIYPCSACHAVFQQGMLIASDPRITAMRRDIMALESGNAAERAGAAERLGQTRREEAVPSLIAVLDDPNPSVRAWAAWALGKIKSPHAIEPLIRSLDKHLKLAKGKMTTTQETRCITDFYLALESITGKKHGMDINKWKEYQDSIKSK
jgi:hypothetical protein